MLIRRRPVVLVIVVALLYGGPSIARAAFQVQGGIGFVAVTGAPEGLELALDDPGHAEVGRGTTDRFGSLIFRDLAPGLGYVVRETAAGATPFR